MGGHVSHPRWLRAALAALVLLSASASACVSGAADRVALLIGNARYANPAFDLHNPGNDAGAVAAALRALGFETDVLVDADRATMAAALEGFAIRAGGAEVALVFFAGHGVQIAGENHLLGSGFDAVTRDEIARESIGLDAMRAALARAAPGLGLIVLDACRSNPLADSGLTERGLARAQGGRGLLIAYATDPGNVAYDGLDANSIFSAALVDHLATPGLEVRLMFGRVRQDVVLASGGRQVPWVEEAVLGEHYLQATTAPPAVTAVTAPPPDELAAWQAAAEDGSAAAYARYLDAYPAGLFQALATERRERLAAAMTSPPAAPPAGADREALSAALTTLGFLSPARGQPAAPADVDAAFASYAGRSGTSRPADVYLDAAQVAVMLAAATAQRIRTDIAALASIETALGMARRARGELAALAEGSAAAGAALERAGGDIAAMQESRATVLARLDRSRTFYATLVERAGRHFRPYLARALPGMLDRARGSAASDARIAEDAGRFVQHATAEGVARAEGSYAWLIDFLPPDLPPDSSPSSSACCSPPASR